MDLSKTPEFEHEKSLPKGILTLPDVLISGLANMGPAMSLFFSAAFLVATVGQAVPFVVVVTLFAILTLGNTLAEFSKKIPSSGSFVTFVGRTFGARFATASSITLVVGYIAAISGVIAVLGGWIATLVQRYSGDNVSWIIIMVIGAVLITYLTIRGVKVSSRWAVVLLFFEALILLVLSFVILAKGGKSGLSLTPFNPLSALGGWNSIALSFPLVVFIFVGWENSGALAEETTNPTKNVPRAVFLGIVIIAILYVISTYAMTVGYGTSPADLKAFANDSGPFDTLGKMYLGNGRILVDLAGLTSIFATIVAAANSQARILFNAGREGLVPKVFGKVSSKSKTPYMALLTYMGVATVLAIIFGYKIGPYEYFGYATTLGTIPLIIMYGLANIALPVYFWRHHRAEFKVWRHLIVPIVGVLVLIFPFWALVQPGQAFPYNWFPWLVLALILGSVVWTLILSAKDRTLADRVLEAFKE